MTKKFFVYGTLKVGGRFAAMFDDTRTSSKKAVLKGFDLYGIGPGKTAGFPGIVKGKGKVHGELHEFSDKVLSEVTEAMDRIEGYDENYEKGSLYLRKTTEVELEDGTKEEAFVYVFNQRIGKDYPLLKEGVWKI